MVHLPDAQGTMGETAKYRKTSPQLAFLGRSRLDKGLSSNAFLLASGAPEIPLDESARPRAQPNLISDRKSMLTQNATGFRMHARSVCKRIFHFLLHWLGIRRLREHSFFGAVLLRPAAVAPHGRSRFPADER